MKRTLKKAMSVLLAFTLLFGSLAFGLSDVNFADFAVKASAEYSATSGKCGDNLTWTFDESTGTLSISGTGDMTDYGFGTPNDFGVSLHTIAPWYYFQIKKIDIINGVTSIGEEAFLDFDSLESVIIPDSVTEIGDYAFYSCDSLSSIKLPENLVDIGSCAFFDCSGLLSIVIPNQITTLNGSTFLGCTNLKSVDFPNQLSAIESQVFLGCKSLKEVTLPTGIKKIGANSFSGCKSLLNITMPYGLEEIEKSAFSGCVSLTNIYIPKSVRKIDENAFSGSNGYAIGVLTAPQKSNEELESFLDCYKECINLESINVDSENLYYYSDEYGVLFDKNKTKLIQYPVGNKRKSYSVPAGVKKFSERAFSSCVVLENIVIPDGITILEDNLFSDCVSLKNVALPETLIEIGESVFEGCSTLESIDIPNQVKYIDSRAFAACYNLKSVKFGSSKTAIENYVFEDCVNLMSVTIPDTVMGIGKGAFYNCMSMDYIHIPSNITLMDEEIIMSDSEKAIIIEDAKYELEIASEEKLAEFAAMGVTKESVANWKSTTVICSDSEDSLAKTYAEKNGHEFVVCDGSHRIKAPDIITGICGEELTWTLGCGTGELTISGTGDMYDYSNLNSPWLSYGSIIESVTIEDGVTRIGNYAFAGCYILSDTTIPDSVTSIGEYAFWGCLGMEYFHIPSTVTLIGESVIMFDSEKAENIDEFKSDMENASEDDWKEIEEMMGITKEKVANWEPTTVICSDTEDCYAKTYAEKNGNEFKVCDGIHRIELPDEPTTEPTTVPYVEPTTQTVETMTQIAETTTKVEETTANVTEPSTTKPADVPSTTKSVIETTTKPVEVPATKPVETTKPAETIEPTTEPVAEPTTKPTTEPTKPEPTTVTVVEEEIIKKPSTTEVKYGETLILHADFTNIPEGATIEWSVEGKGVTIVPSADGKTCAVTSTATGDVTITAKYVDVNGVEYISEQEIKSNASFWQKIVSFFKNLFGISRIIEQVIKF